jgi:hypothetical protein
MGYFNANGKDEYMGDWYTKVYYHLRLWLKGDEISGYDATSLDDVERIVKDNPKEFSFLLEKFTEWDENERPVFSSVVRCDWSGNDIEYLQWILTERNGEDCIKKE